ncbi:efflux RND transporter permease subunit [Aurantivibrio plasticivorans]
MANFTQRILRNSLQGTTPVIIFVLALFAGLLSLQLTPREEEPQIVVPMIDVQVSAPGLSAQQVERQVTTPLEKLLAQIPGVEHLYSTTASGQASVTLRFYVGEDREDSLLNTYNKLYSNQDAIPPVVEQWQVNPIEVDDVPVLLLALWSSEPAQYDDFELRRVAQELSTAIQSIPQTSEVNVVGGRPRTVKVELDPESLAARKTTIAEVISALKVSNTLTIAGNRLQQAKISNDFQTSITVELQSGDYLRSVDELNDLVVNMINGQPVFVKDIASVIDGPADPTHYTWIDFTGNDTTTLLPSEDTGKTDYPMVSISVAKQPGSNAVAVTENVHALLGDFKAQFLPDSMHITVLRDYGQTADEKVNNLIQSLGFAIFTVVIFIGVFLGWRQAWVVALAVPICYGITLALDMAFGYTINRVTLFALILALGLLVDDPITGVDNISRFLFGGAASKDITDRDGKIVAAIEEIRSPLVMSTFTIVLAFIPLAFITGMMGPYMAPMAFNVPVSVITSTVVAFLVTPWLTKKILKSDDSTDSESGSDDTPLLSFYRKVLSPILDNPRWSKRTLWSVLILFIGACTLPLFRLVPLKLLPFDNKNEIQILVELPASSSLETTAALSKQIANRVTTVPEVNAIASYIGIPSPIDFNGMVRGYYKRAGNHFADMRLILADKSIREHQSHGIVLRIRALLADLNQGNTKIKVVEVPPGPPVLSTLVAEIYGTRITDYATQQDAAAILVERLQREPHVVEVESSAKVTAPVYRFYTDKQKAALSGISSADVNQALLAANQGVVAGFLQLPREASPLPIEVRLPLSQRHSESDLLRIHVKGKPGVTKTSNENGLVNAAQPLVALGEIGAFEQLNGDQIIQHKDLKPVVYVMAELSGRTPAEVIADVNADLIIGTDDNATANKEISSWQSRHFLSPGAGDLWKLPDNTSVRWTGEGEWKITVDVFRDMGIAFAFALIAIFIVLRYQTQSVSLSLIIMSAIPLTMIGIMPGFWLLNQFGERTIAGAPEPILFTATAMIGMIALAGIVVRNSLILVEFITQSRTAGMPIKEALIRAGAVRMRPVLLTAGTTLLGNFVITLDPVFSGLALAIIFGIVASTLFTLLVVPVVYYLVFKNDENTSEVSP